MNLKLLRLKKYLTPAGIKKGFSLISRNINISRRDIHATHRPYSVTINIEGRCNLSCIYCCYHNELTDRRYQGWSLTFEQVKPEVDLLWDFGVKHIHLCGSGEPFLNKDIFKIFHYIRSKGAITSVLSNATALNQRMLEQIIEAKLDVFNTDLDLVDRKDFARIKGRDCLNTLLANIETLVKLRNKSKSPMKIGVYTLITKESVPVLGDILNTCIALGIDTWCLEYLVVDFEDRGYLTRENAMLFRHGDVRAAIRPLLSVAKRHGIALYYPKYLNPHYDAKKIFCMRPWSNFMLNIPNLNMPKEKWYGNVVCGCSSNKTHQYVYGNIFEQSLEEIWNGAAIKELRKNLISNSDIECKTLCVEHCRPV